MADIKDEIKRVRDELYRVQKQLEKIKNTKTFQRFGKDSREAVKGFEDVSRAASDLFSRLQGREAVLNRLVKEGAAGAKNLANEMKKVDKEASSTFKNITLNQRSGLRDTFSSLQFFAEQQLKWYASKAVTLRILAIPSEVIDSVKEYNQGLVDIAAVTRAANASLDTLGKTIVSVATSTKFSIADIAESGKLLAQAGLSLKEINDTLLPIAQIATATSSTIQDSADVMITALRAYKKSASDAVNIADTFINISNNSKVTIHGLGVAFNYLAGTTAILGISLKQTSALVGILANSGLKLSTAATGLRTALLYLEAPTDKMRRIFARYKISIDSVNPSLHKMTDILKTLSVISKEDLIKAFSIRSANAILALQNAGVDAINELRSTLDKSGVASLEAKEQLLGLANAWDNFKQTISSTEALLGKAQTNVTVDLLKGFQHSLVEYNKGLKDSKEATSSWLTSILALGATLPIMMSLSKYMRTFKVIGKDAQGAEILANGLQRLTGKIKLAVSSLAIFTGWLFETGSAATAFNIVLESVIGSFSMLSGLAVVATAIYSLSKAYLQAKENIGKFYNNLVRVESALAKDINYIQKANVSLKEYTNRVMEAYGANTKLTEELLKQQKIKTLNSLQSELVSPLKSVNLSDEVYTKLAKSLGYLSKESNKVITQSEFFKKVFDSAGLSVNKLEQSYSKLYKTLLTMTKLNIKDAASPTFLGDFSTSQLASPIKEESYGKLLSFLDKLHNAKTKDDLNGIVEANQDLIESLARTDTPLARMVNALIALDRALLKTKSTMDSFTEDSNKLIKISSSISRLITSISAQGYLTSSQFSSYITKLNEAKSALESLRKVDTSHYTSKELLLYNDQIDSLTDKINKYKQSLSSTPVISDATNKTITDIILKSEKGTVTIDRLNRVLQVTGERIQSLTGKSASSFLASLGISDKTTNVLESINKKINELRLSGETANMKAIKALQTYYAVIQEKGKLAAKQIKELFSGIKVPSLNTSEMDKYNLLKDNYLNPAVQKQVGINPEFLDKFKSATPIIIAFGKEIDKVLGATKKSNLSASLSRVITLLSGVKDKTMATVKVLDKLKNYKARVDIQIQLKTLKAKEQIEELKSKLGLTNNLNTISSSLYNISPEQTKLKTQYAAMQTETSIESANKDTKYQAEKTKALYEYYANITKINKNIVNDSKLRDELIYTAHKIYTEKIEAIDRTAAKKQLDLIIKNTENKLKVEKMGIQDFKAQGELKLQILRAQEQQAVLQAKEAGLQTKYIEEYYDKLIMQTKLEYSNKAADGIKLGIAKLAADTKSGADYMVQAMQGAAQAMESSFSNLFFDAMQGKLKSLGDYFMSFASSVEKTISQLLSKMLVNSLFGSISGGGGSSLLSLLGFAKGAVFEDGIQKFATGGLITKPTIFPMASGGIGLAGEAGTEAILPLGRDSNGDLGVKGSSNPVHFNIVNTIDPNLVGDYLSTPSGENTILNVIQKHSYTVKRSLNLV